MTMLEACLKYMGNIEDRILDLNVFDHDIVVTGATGTGKTTLVQKVLLPKYESVPIWILDPKRKFSNFGKVVKSLNELDKKYQYVYQPNDLRKNMFGAFCEKALNEKYLVLVIDEIHLWLGKQSIFKPHQDLVLTKRNDGVRTISISTSTKAIPNYLLGNVTHVYTLRYNLRNDIDWLDNYIGVKSEFLLAPDLRKPINTMCKDEQGNDITFRDMPRLKPYSFIYRDLRKNDSAIFGGFEGID